MKGQRCTSIVSSTPLAARDNYYLVRCVCVPTTSRLAPSLTAEWIRYLWLEASDWSLFIYPSHIRVVSLNLKITYSPCHLPSAWYGINDRQPAASISIGSLHDKYQIVYSAFCEKMVPYFFQKSLCAITTNK